MKYELYLLQCRGNPINTSFTRITRRRSRSSRSHPVARLLGTSLLLAVHLLSVFFRRRRRQISSSTREGQRRGRSERLSLLSSRRVCRQGIHDCSPVKFDGIGDGKDDKMVEDNRSLTDERMLGGTVLEYFGGRIVNSCDCSMKMQ